MKTTLFLYPRLQINACIYFDVFIELKSYKNTLATVTTYNHKVENYIR